MILKSLITSITKNNYVNLKDKKILITGAAGRIGSSIAKLAFKKGATVILNDIHKQKLNSLEDELNKIDSFRVFCVIEDITNTEGIDRLISKSIKKVNSISSAIHAAYPTSMQWGNTFEDINFSNLEKDLSMQLGSAIIFSQKILKQFVSQKYGELIHISSIQGIGAPKFDHYEGTEIYSPIEYTAIKSGIIAITKWLAKYYQNKGIRINCVSPGGILDNQPQIFLDRYRKSCNNIGMLSSEDIAKVVLFLISSESSAISGQNIIIDDGWSL